LLVPPTIDLKYEQHNLIIYSNTSDGKTIGKTMCISQQPGTNPLQQKSILQACDMNNFAQNYERDTSKIKNIYHQSRCLGVNINSGYVGFFPCTKTRTWKGTTYELPIDYFENIHLEWDIDRKKPYNIYLKQNSPEKICLGVDKNATNSLYVSPKLCKGNHFLLTQDKDRQRFFLGRYIAYTLILIIIFQRLSFEEVFYIMKNGGITVDSVRKYQDLQMKSSKYKANFEKDKRTFAYIFEWVMYRVIVLVFCVLFLMLLDNPLSIILPAIGVGIWYCCCNSCCNTKPKKNM
jgi:hypothetical protein